jgi:hypothetical protein
VHGHEEATTPPPTPPTHTYTHPGSCAVPLPALPAIDGAALTFSVCVYVSVCVCVCVCLCVYVCVCVWTAGRPCV